MSRERPISYRTAAEALGISERRARYWGEVYLRRDPVWDGCSADLSDREVDSLRLIRDAFALGLCDSRIIRRMLLTTRGSGPLVAFGEGGVRRIEVEDVPSLSRLGAVVVLRAVEA